MENLTLYYHPLSPPCRSSIMVARELKIDLKLKEVDFLNHGEKSESFSKINPAQTIPTLVDKDIIICDSHAINIYLVEKYAQNDSLFPSKDLILRTKIIDRMFFDASFLFPRGFFASVIFHGKAEIPQYKIEGIHRGYKVLEKYLEKTKNIASDDLTLADLCLFAWMESIVQVIPVSPNVYPKLTLWLKQMRKLPYYREANQAGADYHIKVFNEALARNIKNKL
ncbi:CLUMA_CG006540, isoform A [Clunio marinus]|uniref:glutathione transferase n=1 Tax=Clunio marinus TaxID=568069 RepID=A0A1J1HYL8_9DIPT|nr:CLUMA_CG006540, isoform A [Clunio marinus]